MPNTSRKDGLRLRYSKNIPIIFQPNLKERYHFIIGLKNNRPGGSKYEHWKTKRDYASERRSFSFK
jgi:hypothetical protein